MVLRGPACCHIIRLPASRFKVPLREALWGFVLGQDSSAASQLPLWESPGIQRGDPELMGNQRRASRKHGGPGCGDTGKAAVGLVPGAQPSVLPSVSPTEEDDVTLRAGRDPGHHPAPFLPPPGEEAQGQRGQALRGSKAGPGEWPERKG